MNHLHPIEAIILILGAIVLCALAYLATSCKHDDCKFASTRCAGRTVQMCDADRDWDDVMDCDEIFDLKGRDWTCCESDAGAECLPEVECETP
jgi:ABC-type protease/lipase transport system fused ATPase/permease subunit